MGLIMKKRRLIVPALIFLICLLMFLSLSLAAAAQFVIPWGDDSDDTKFVVTIVKDKVATDEWAEFEVKIISTFGLSQELTMHFPQDGTDWSLTTDPTSHYASGIGIEPNSVVTTKLFFKPRKDLPRSSKRPYNIPLEFRNNERGILYTLPFKV